MKNRIGISFSKNHCYLTQFTQKKENLSLTSVTSFSYEEDLLRALSTNAAMIKSLAANSACVVLAIPSQTVLFKTILIDPSLTDKEIICHIQSQSQNLFGFSPEQLCFDYETSLVEEDNRHIIIAATHQQKIAAYQRCFDDLKIPLTAIDIDVFSLLRLTSFLINDQDFILLFHHDDDIFITVIRNGKLQKTDSIHLSSLQTAQSQLNSFLSTNEKIIVFNGNQDLKTHLNKFDISYQTLDINSLFDSPIQNKTPIPISELHPFLISIGAGLWSNT